MAAGPRFRAGPSARPVHELVEDQQEAGDVGELRLEAGLAEIDEAMPTGAAAGARYAEAGMRAVGR